jgi:quinoprotein glucose dehydrogenase
MRHGDVFTPPSLNGTLASPGFVGGMEWGGVGYDPGSGLLVVNTNHVPMFATLIRRGEVEGRAPDPEEMFPAAMQAPAPYAVRRGPLLSPLGIPCTRPPWGMLHAVDMRTGAVVWERPLGTVRDLARIPTPTSWGSPNLGGPLVTGGVVFLGATMDRTLRAFDLRTGELLWKKRLPASANATPMTYRARPGGRQFVVVAAGGHDGMHSALGDYVVAYALPGSDAPGADR